MIRKYLITGLLTSLTVIASAQYENTAISSSSFFGLPLTLKSSSGEYYLNYSPMASTKTHLAKVDLAGNFAWNYSYDFGGADFPLDAFCETANGKLVGIGSTGGNFVTSVFDAATGAPVSRDYRIIQGGYVGGYSNIYKIKSDGNDAVFITTCSSQDSLMIGKALSSNGSLSFVKIIDVSSVINATGAYSMSITAMCKTAAGDYLAVCDINDYTSSTHKQIFLRFDATGNISFLKYYTTPATFTSFYAHDLIETANGDFLMSGGLTEASQQGNFLMRLDANANFLWAKKIPNGSSSSYVTEHSNGDIALGVSAQTFSPDNLYRSGIIRLTSAGNFLWCRNFGGTSSAVKKVETGTGGFTEIIAFNSSFANQGAIQLLTADANGGMAGCGEYIPNIPVNTFSVTLSSFTPTVTNASLNLSTPFNFNNYPGLSFTTSSPSVNISGVISNPLCYGGFGNVNISVSNGAPNYAYSWSNGTSNQNLLNVLGGTYYIRVSDTRGCVGVDTFTVISPPQLTATSSVTNVTCFGSQNGAIDITPIGGTPGYTFQWATLDTTEDLTGLSGGFYQVIITDSNNCQKTVGIAVQEPTQLISGISSSQNVSCYGMCNGSLTGIASGGTQPYTYSWNNPGSSTTTTVSGLCPGNYLFTVTDAKNCVSFSNGIVTEPNPLNVSAIAAETQCGTNGGYAFASSTGGVAPYSYLWTGGIANDTALSLANGTYTVTVTDANNCTATGTALVGIETAPQNICLVTVDSMNHNVVVWEKAIATNIAGYNIYRNVTGAYSLIGYVPYDSLSEFVDLTFGVDPNITSYRYEISAVDTCGYESALSPYHQTIHLTSNVGVGGEVNLIWDNYEGFGFSYNRILRDSTYNGNWQVLDSVAATNFTWTDLNPPDSARYIIEVISPAACASTRAIINTSRSNIKAQIAAPTIGMEENSLLSASVYPNPASESLFIHYPYNAEKTRVNIYDALGKLVHQSQITASTHEINVRDFSDGIYFLVITENDLPKAKGKFIVE